MHEIKEAAVFEVLLSDGWHKPIEGSFKLDRFAIKSLVSGDIRYGDSTAIWRESVVAGTTSTFAIAAPLSSVIAIKEKVSLRSRMPVRSGALPRQSTEDCITLSLRGPTLASSVKPDFSNLCATLFMGGS